SNEANERSKDTAGRQTDVENRFDDQIAGNTDIDEVIDARRPEGEEAYPTLRKRLDEEHQEVTARFAQLAININDLGADPTGSADSTEAIERAINLAGNGGTVLIPKGTFISNLETDCDNINFYFKGKLIPLYEEVDYCLKLT